MGPHTSPCCWSHRGESLLSAIGGWKSQKWKPTMPWSEARTLQRRAMRVSCSWSKDRHSCPTLYSQVVQPCPGHGGGLSGRQQLVIRGRNACANKGQTCMCVPPCIAKVKIPSRWRAARPSYSERPSWRRRRPNCSTRSPTCASPRSFPRTGTKEGKGGEREGRGHPP